jgi:hypothetical protein
LRVRFYFFSELFCLRLAHPTQRNNNGFHQFGQRRILCRIVRLDNQTVAGQPATQIRRTNMTLEVGDVTWFVDKEFEEAITALVDAVVGLNTPRGPYSEPVFKAARNVAEAYLAACAGFAFDNDKIISWPKSNRKRQSALDLGILTASAKPLSRMTAPLS